MGLKYSLWFSLSHDIITCKVSPLNSQWRWTRNNDVIARERAHRLRETNSCNSIFTCTRGAYQYARCCRFEKGSCHFCMLRLVCTRVILIFLRRMLVGRPAVAGIFFLLTSVAVTPFLLAAVMVMVFVLVLLVSLTHLFPDFTSIL